MLVLLHLLVHTNRVTGLPRRRERDAIRVYEYVYKYASTPQTPPALRRW